MLHGEERRSSNYLLPIQYLHFLNGVYELCMLTYDKVNVSEYDSETFMVSFEVIGMILE